MSKHQQVREKNLSILIIAILMLSIFIISIEVLFINKGNRDKEERNGKEVNNNSQSVTRNTSFYDTSNLVFSQIDLTNASFIADICTNGCNLKINGSDILFIIKKNALTEEYILDLVSDKKAILENKKLGTSLDGAIILNYGEYKTLKMKIKNNDYLYDYALFIDNKGLVDEVSSLNADEIELLENGVIYYYDTCSEGVGKKVKAVRAPFSETPAVISSTEESFSWCD